MEIVEGLGDALLCPWVEGEELAKYREESSDWQWVLAYWRRRDDGEYRTKRGPIEHDLANPQEGLQEGPQEGLQEGPLEEQPVARKKKGAPVVYTFVRHRDALYNSDTSEKIAFKCLVAQILLIPYAALRATYHAVKGITTPLFLLHDFFLKCSDLSGEENSLLSIAGHAKEFLQESVEGVGYHLWEIARIPFYALGLMIAFTRGWLYDPLGARRACEIIEYEWNHRISIDWDFRAKLGDAKVFYLTWCFQRIGTLEEQVKGRKGKKHHRFEIIEGFSSVEEAVKKNPLDLGAQKLDMPCPLFCAPEKL